MTGLSEWKQAVKHFHPFVVTVVGDAFANNCIDALEQKEVIKFQKIMFFYWNMHYFANSGVLCKEFYHPVIVYSNNPQCRSQDYRVRMNVFAQCSSWSTVLDAANTAIETQVIFIFSNKQYFLQA